LLLDGRHRDIARIALAAAGRKYEVAFAGGGALQIHDVSARRTQDVDLFVRKARNVMKAADVIANALERAGYRVEAVSADDPGWVDLSQELREFEVYPPDSGDPVQVQVAFFAYTGTVTTDVGPVVTLDYLAARKTVALVLLTELSTPGCRILGQQQRPVARFRACDIRGRRERPGRTGRAVRRETARDRGPVGAIPTA
jgi:hypothetical protein